MPRSLTFLAIRCVDDWRLHTNQPHLPFYTHAHAGARTDDIMTLPGGVTNWWYLYTVRSFLPKRDQRALAQQFPAPPPPGCARAVNIATRHGNNEVTPPFFVCPRFDPPETRKKFEHTLLVSVHKSGVLYVAAGNTNL